MLVLRRKIGESIVIAGSIRIRVAGVSGSHVKLEIDAPREVPVYREEVWEAIRKEMVEAAGSELSGAPRPAKPEATGGIVIDDSREKENGPAAEKP